MDKKYKIRTLIFIYVSLGIAIHLFDNHNYKDDDYIIYQSNEEPFGAYKKGNIYIGDHEYIEKIKNKIKPGDILIEQGYNLSNKFIDPNYKIYSSYRITDKDDRNAILNVLNIYNTSISFEFDRTIESMRVEWSIHNFLYKIGIEQNRTKDVDLNNDDEKIYSNPILKKVFK